MSHDPTADERPAARVSAKQAPVLSVVLLAGVCILGSGEYFLICLPNMKTSRKNTLPRPTHGSLFDSSKARGRERSMGALDRGPGGAATSSSSMGYTWCRNTPRYANRRKKAPQETTIASWLSTATIARAK